MGEPMEQSAGKQREGFRIPAVSTGREGKEVRVISLEADILEENDRIAAQNRDYLTSLGIYTLNMISSPGSGKTTLLVETLHRLKDEIGCAVIEGDQRTSNDAQRIAKTGVPVVQINTRQACHLNASQIRESLDELPLKRTRLLFVENVGNLICPAGMDLGESEKIALMSITEGEDKPAKYPVAFTLASTVVLTKMDLLPHLRFDLGLCKAYLQSVNPRIRILETSVYAEKGLEAWLDYLRARV